ncbi:MAG: serine/threonine protein kinase [Cyanosarcina radialis HA8281-LM2]|jgi:WD40 repeat protein|nr:serine/threonine protein kinase [Cyanosarcina radialis HA8281-LM2]
MSILKERYQIVKQLAKSKFSNSFLAIDLHRSPSIYCVVQLWRSLIPTSDLETTSARLRQQQLQSLKKLGKHPQIPTVIDYFEENNNFYLVQEFINGNKLSQLLEVEGNFDEQHIWRLLADLLPVLKFIHDRQVIHRDIKPENIIYRSSTAPLFKGGWGDLVLVDFRSARLDAENDRTQLETDIGSPEYTAPEQTRGKAVFASDIYSLGVTCIYLMTGISPFDLFDTSSDRWVWQQYLTQTVSDRLAHVLDKSIQRDLNLRWRSIDEILPALGTYLNLNLQPSTSNSPLWECVATLVEHSRSTASINSVAFSPIPPTPLSKGGKGEILASASDDGNIRLWNVNTRQVIGILTGHSQPVNSIAFSPDSQILASGSSDRTIKLWDLATGQEIRTLAGHSHGVRSVAFRPLDPHPALTGTPLPSLGEGTGVRAILASGSWDKTIKLWDVETGEEICTLKGHQLQVSAVAFSPNGQFLASASFDRTARLWDLSSGLPQVLYTFTGHARSVLAVGFSPDSSMLATAGDDNTICLWNCASGQAIATILGHSRSVATVAFSLDGETVISGSWDSNVKLWQVSTGEEIATLAGHTDAVCALAVSPLGEIVASGSKDKTIKLWQRI